MRTPAANEIPDGFDVRGDRLAKCALPTAGRHKFWDGIRTIEPATLVRLMEGEFADQFDNFIIIDSRFPYEYSGGHIHGARNMWTCEQTSGQLLDQPTTNLTQGARTAIVFHCEFSAVRGPTQYKYIREMDRTITCGTPELIYPEVSVRACDCDSGASLCVAPAAAASTADSQKTALHRCTS